VALGYFPDLQVPAVRVGAQYTHRRTHMRA
jgi:hypothetical protein